jgi:hypothetical protein
MGAVNEGRRKLRIPIRPDYDAVLYLTLPMTEEDWRQFQAVLTAMKPGIVFPAEEAPGG